MTGSGNRDEDQENMSSQTDNMRRSVCVPQMLPTTGELCGEGENK
jgi:hypothetical protein